MGSFFSSKNNRPDQQEPLSQAEKPKIEKMQHIKSWRGMDMWENNLPYKAHICELPFSEKKVNFLPCKHLQWRPIQMRAFHSNENGLFCTHPLSVAPLFWWKERGKQEALI